MNPAVDAFMDTAKKWPQELKALRAILLQCNLTEELKWGAPCYTYAKSNILILHAFKAYCAIGFFKGALLEDPLGLLVKAGENSQLGKQFRFSGVAEINEQAKHIKSFIKAAIEIEQSGVKAPQQPSAEIAIPDELSAAFKDNAAFKSAFQKLTPGRQRAYLIFFTAPKQSATRATRIAKYVNQIMDGKGINDCTCGLSKKMPGCDGSHKQLHSINRVN